MIGWVHFDSKSLDGISFLSEVAAGTQEAGEKKNFTLAGSEFEIPPSTRCLLYPTRLINALQT